MPSIYFIEDSDKFDGSTFWVDEIPELKFFTDEQSYTTCELFIGEDRCYYASTLWPSADVSEFFPNALSVGINITEIIEEEMKYRKLAIMTLKVRFTQEGGADSQKGEEEVSFSVLYRAGITTPPAEDFTKGSFLTTASVKLLPLGGSDSLYFVSYRKETARIRHVLQYMTAEGVIEEKETLGFNVTYGGNPARYSTNPKWDLSKIPAGARPLALIVSVGLRRMVYYPMERAEAVFRFRNQFNCIEYCHTPSLPDSKQTHKASAGAVNSRLVRYDFEAKEEFTVNFGPAGPDDIRYLSQLSRSEETYYAEFHGGDVPDDQWRRIIVESAEWDSALDPDSLKSPSMTFRTEKASYTALPTGINERLHTDEFDVIFN